MELESCDYKPNFLREINETLLKSDREIEGETKILAKKAKRN